jgi:hypothetical protein
MAAIAVRPFLVVLLVLAFLGHTLAAAAMHCKTESQDMQVADAAMDMHQHHHEQPATDRQHPHSDCCATKGQCLMACSLALAGIDLPPAHKIPVPAPDTYSDLVPAGVISSFYKPPISG